MEGRYCRGPAVTAVLVWVVVAQPVQAPDDGEVQPAQEALRLTGRGAHRGRGLAPAPEEAR